MIRAAMASVARASVIPMQDVLDLGVNLPTNTPSTTGGNWRWRLKSDYACSADTDRLAELTSLYERA